VRSYHANLGAGIDGPARSLPWARGVGRDLAVGDRVSAAIFPRWIDGRFAFDVADQLGGSLDGMLTEYALLDADALVRIPDHLSSEVPTVTAAAKRCYGHWPLVRW
jgi:hypothetical protein